MSTVPKMVAIALAVLSSVVVGLVGLVLIASEFGGEVVTLRTFDESGEAYETSLWIAEDEGALWLRAGDPGSGWLKRIETRSEVELERNGATGRYEATAVPAHSARLNDLLAERYGWADGVIDALLGRGDATAVRLDPRP